MWTMWPSGSPSSGSSSWGYPYGCTTGNGRYDGQGGTARSAVLLLFQGVDARATVVPSPPQGEEMMSARSLELSWFRGYTSIIGSEKEFDR
ncbi:hypothetical protein EVC30_061 [Rhizobium phage RHph_Y1_11]|nr:hypothetical protein EVC30_061 [Rhizobium phage RHph_Y1_11]